MVARTFLRWLGPALATLLPAGIGAAAILFQPGFAVTLRNIAFDAQQEFLPRAFDPNGPVRVVDIDEDSLARYGQWPWPRDRIAAAVDRLGQLGAAVVGLDVILAEPDRSSPSRVLASVPDSPAKQEVLRALGGGDNDAVLAQALARTPSVIGLLLSDDVTNRPPVKAGFAEAGDPAAPFLQHYSGAIVPLPALAEAAKGIGAFNWLPEKDLVIRRVPLLLAVDGALVPSFALECLRIALGASTVQVKASNASGETAFGRQVGIVSVRLAGEGGQVIVDTEGDGALRVRFAGSQAGRHIPFWRLAEGEVRPEEVEGRIVLIGSSAAVLNDLRATPIEPAVAGVDVHAEVIEQIVGGARLVRPLYAPALELLATLAGCLAAGLAARRLRPATAAAAVGILVALSAGGAWAAHAGPGIALDPVVPSLSILAAYVATSLVLYRSAERERRAIRDAFEHYVSPDVVERLASDPASLRLGGETRELTVLFCDLRGFTARAENMDAEQVVRFLNAFHTPLTEAVLATRGTIDKYLGDGLMAFWNAPLPDDDHVEHACRAALAMLASLPALRQRFAGASGAEHPVEIGIGLHMGPACVGNLGTATRFDYSIVGDAVNVAARLEPQSKVFGVPIVVSAAVVARAPGFGFVPLGEAMLKGKSRAMPLFALHGAPEDLGEGFTAFREAHEAAFRAFQAGSDDLPESVAAAAAHPEGIRYAALYASWLAGLPRQRRSVTS